MYPVRRQISPHAARLRREMTDVERLLWDRLRNRQLNGLKFRRQASLGPFIVDFLCIEARLIVELDGGHHSTERDAGRTQWLEGEGYQTLRFRNHEVAENVDGVLERIVITSMATRKTLTQPSRESRASREPAKAGEG